MNVFLLEPRLGSYTLEKYDGRGISREMVSEAANLFSREYGVWCMVYGVRWRVRKWEREG